MIVKSLPTLTYSLAWLISHYLINYCRFHIFTLPALPFVQEQQMARHHKAMAMNLSLSCTLHFSPNWCKTPTSHWQEPSRWSLDAPSPAWGWSQTRLLMLEVPKAPQVTQPRASLSSLSQHFADIQPPCCNLNTLLFPLLDAESWWFPACTSFFLHKEGSLLQSFCLTLHSVSILTPMKKSGKLYLLYVE